LAILKHDRKRLYYFSGLSFFLLSHPRFPKSDYIAYVKFETLTYQAPLTDFSVGEALGPNEAPLTSPKGEISPAYFSHIAGWLWAWMSHQICAYLTAVMSGNPKARLVQMPATAIGSDEPLRVVRLNRSIKRKLARLERRNPLGERVMAIYEHEDSGVSPAQYMERRIRTERIGRTRIYGLNLTRLELIIHAVKSAWLQGHFAKLCNLGVCAAPLSPD